MERMGLPVTPELLEETNGDVSSTRSMNPVSKTIRLLDEEPSVDWRKIHIKLDESHHANTAKLALWCEMFIKRFAHKAFRQMILCGSMGCGKTHGAKSIVQFAEAYSVDLWYSGKWHKPPRAVFIDWAEVCEKEKPEAFEDVLYEIKRSDLVVLDDVGAESDRFKAGVGVSRLRRALECCEHKWLVVTCNYQAVQWPDKFDMRVADRLRALKYLDLTGTPSYRPKLQK